MTITALSVRQPWASAILLGKDVENRSRQFRYRGPLLIHASVHTNKDAWLDSRIKTLAIDRHAVPFGHLIGIVMLVDCVRGHDSRWADSGAWHLVLRDPHPLTRPIPYKGQLNIFQVPRRLLADQLPAWATVQGELAI